MLLFMKNGAHDTHKNSLYPFFASSLSRPASSTNWQVMDFSDTDNLKKYYINVCRPINPIPGCDQHASVCQMKYTLEQVCNHVENRNVTLKQGNAQLMNSY